VCIPVLLAELSSIDFSKSLHFLRNSLIDFPFLPTKKRPLYYYRALVFSRMSRFFKKSAMHDQHTSFLLKTINHIKQIFPENDEDAL